MISERIIALIPVFAMLIVATWIDMRTRRIPNWLTLSLAATGILQSFLPHHTVTPTYALLGVLVGFALNLPLFALKIRGGGDLKLFVGLGAWMGPLMTTEIFVVSTIFASVVAIIQCAATGKLTALFKNTAVLAVSVAHPKELGVAYVTRPDGTFKSVGGRLPYAVPMILGTVLAILIG